MRRSSSATTRPASSLDAQEEELPPLTETIAGAAADLAVAYSAAIAAAAAQLPDARVAVFRATDPVPAPGAVLGDACIDGFRRHVKNPDAAIERALFAAHDGDDAVALDPANHAPPALQRTLRRFAQRLEWLKWIGGHGAQDEDRRRAWDERSAGIEHARRELRTALALLNGSDGAPLLTVLWDERRSWEATIETAGAERVAQLRERLRPRGAAAATPPRRGPVRTRADLHAALASKGLERVADAIVADARIGIALPFGEGRSRLGGVPELPAGVDWPQREGRALTPLAAIDCAELPPQVDDRDLLPADGALLVLPHCTTTSPAPRSWGTARCRRATAGSGCCTWRPRMRPHPVQPPDDLGRRGEYELGLLHERTVAPRAIMTLRDRLHAQEAFGLGTGETEAYGDLCDELWGPDRAEVAGQLLGHPLPVQEDPREEGQELLFELAWSEPLGFEFLDGGSIHLLGRPADLRAGRWEQLVAWADTS